MKLNVKSFSITVVTIISIPLLILFIWCSANGFGLEFVALFESIHPSGGIAISENLVNGFTACIPGILVDLLYTLLDTFIFSFLFAQLYNLLLKIDNDKKSKSKKASKKKKTAKNIDKNTDKK